MLRSSLLSLSCCMAAFPIAGSLASSIASAAPSRQQLDLYNVFIVRERHKVTAEGINVPCGCSAEEQNDEECVNGTVLFYFEGHCHPISGTTGHEGLSLRFWDENSTHACLQVNDVAASDCNSRTHISGQCDALWRYGKCYNDSTYVFQRLEDWCIQSDRPIDDYNIPMASMVVSSDVNDCQQQHNVVHDYFPVQDSLCVPRAVLINGELEQGSEIRTCDWDDGTLKTQYFAGLGCQRAHSRRRHGGSEPDIRNGIVTETCEEQFDSVVMSANCRQAEFFCKDFVAAGLGQRVHVIRSFQFNGVYAGLLPLMACSLTLLIVVCIRKCRGRCERDIGESGEEFGRILTV